MEFLAIVGAVAILTITVHGICELIGFISNTFVRIRTLENRTAQLSCEVNNMHWTVSNLAHPQSKATKK